MENVAQPRWRKMINKVGWYDAEAMIAKPNFHSRTIFAKNLIVVELNKLEVKFNKPIYIGMYILESLLIRISSRVYVTTVSRQM